MFNQVVTPPEHLPVLERNRKSTDVICTVIGAIFALVIFIFACIYFSNANINKTYFSNLSSGLNGTNDYNGFKTTLLWTALAALGLGLIWIALASLVPRELPFIVVILNIILLIILGVLVLIQGSGFFGNNQVWKIVVAVVLFLLAIIFIVIALLYSNELRLQGIFLDYSNHFLYHNPLNFLYILLFLILTAGLVALFIFQHAAFGGRAGNSNNFFDFAAPGFLGILNILQFIWGFQFLRDAFNFIISGNAVDWYWVTNVNNVLVQSSQGIKPSGSYFGGAFHRLLCKNWGSVVGGSFLNAFLQIPTLIAELLICHPNTCCNKLGTICSTSCSWFSSIFNLVRTDAYAYINLSGLPYCNSARETARLCENSREFVGSFSPIKHYRFNAHVFLVALIAFLGYLITKYRVLNIGFWNAVVLIVVSYLVITWFIDIHADAAEGIQTSFFAEHSAVQGYQFMQHAYPSFRNQIEHRSNRANSIKDGNW